MKSASALFAFMLFAAGCATTNSSSHPGPSAQAGVAMDLKVTSGVGKLRAKVTLSNSGSKEQVLSGLDPRFFMVETVDGKAMAFKGKTGTGEEIHLAPGQNLETAFDLQNSYPFWDRRTKYRIWYEGGGLKSNVVQVWF